MEETVGMRERFLRAHVPRQERQLEDVAGTEGRRGVGGGNELLLELGFNEALCNKPADQGKRGTFSGAMCLEEGEGTVVHGGVTCPLVLLWVTW